MAATACRAYWYGKHSASSLFGTGRRPSAGTRSQFLGWFYYGGGEALYKELVQNDPQAQPRSASSVFADADPAARLVQEGDSRAATTSRA